MIKTLKSEKKILSFFFQSISFSSPLVDEREKGRKKGKERGNGKLDLDQKGPKKKRCEKEKDIRASIVRTKPYLNCTNKTVPQLYGQNRTSVVRIIVP